MRAIFIGITLMLSVTASAADTPSAATTAKAFGARESIRQASLSPDGNRVALVMASGTRGTALVIADPSQPGVPTTILRGSGNPEQINDCYWSTDSRLVCRIYVVTRNAGARIAYTRMVAIDADGSDLKLLSQNRTGVSRLSMLGGRVIDWLPDDPGAVLLEGQGIQRVDTVTLARKTVEPYRTQAVDYITDGRGTIRMMGASSVTYAGNNAERISYFYRKRGAHEWLPLPGQLNLAGNGQGFDPHAVDPTLDVVYGFDDNAGRRALYRIGLDGGLKKELVLARPDVDIDGLVRVGRQRRVVITLLHE